MALTMSTVEVKAFVAQMFLTKSMLAKAIWRPKGPRGKREGTPIKTASGMDITNANLQAFRSPRVF